jgi:peptidyl-prolyl cis-trans isomerase D
MLEKFRRGAAKFLVTLLFSILIVSFALWGIPNYSRDTSDNTLARVGSARITESEYRRFFDHHLNILSVQAGQRLTRENARLAYRLQQMQSGNLNADLDREVLNLQIAQAALDQQAQALGLALSDAAIVEQIRNDPAYQGADKKFSRAIFEERARQVGLSDVAYIRDRKASELRDQIIDSIVGGLVPPRTLIDIAHKYQEERRTVAYFALDPAKQPKVAEPEEAALREFYEQNKRQFMAPETRKINVLFLTREDVKERAKVSDDEVRAAWEKSKESWNIPERRRIQQIVFRSRDAAVAVAKEIQAGKSFLMAALEENGAQGRLDQGLLARAGISDPKVAAAAFSLPLNQLSEPIEARGGAVLLIRVTEIEPGRTRGFDEVAKDVREDLEQRRQRETATRLTEQIEDLRGAGRTLKQIADELKIKLIEGAEITRSGNGPDGKPAIEHREAQRIVASAFEGAKEIPRDMLELSDGTEVWLEVLAVTPESQKPFEAVKADVQAIWMEAETRKALTAAAQALVDRIKAGETFEAVAKAAGAAIVKTNPFVRNAAVAGLSGAAVRQAFTLPTGGVAVAETPDGKSRIVFVVTEIKVADPPTEEQAAELRRGLTALYQADARTVYVSALRNRLGVTVDEKAYQRIVGADAQR